MHLAGHKFANLNQAPSMLGIHSRTRHTRLANKQGNRHWGRQKPPHLLMHLALQQACCDNNGLQDCCGSSNQCCLVHLHHTHYPNPPQPTKQTPHACHSRCQPYHGRKEQTASMLYRCRCCSAA